MTKVLLQIFSANAIGPIFFEFIQRKGDEGFGEGNFRALFVSIEEDQLRRGVLTREGAAAEAEPWTAATRPAGGLSGAIGDTDPLSRRRRARWPSSWSGTATELSAYRDECPHMFLPLTQRGRRVLSADGERLRCTNHGAEFAVADGRALSGPVAGCGLTPVAIEVGADGPCS